MQPEPVPTAGAAGTRPSWVLPEALQQLAQGDSAHLVSEILEDFRRDVAVRLLKLRQAVECKDGPAAKIEVHSIKGSAAQMGAADLAAACLKLEIETAGGRQSLTAPDVESIQALFERVCTAIAGHPLCARR